MENKKNEYKNFIRDKFKEKGTNSWNNDLDLAKDFLILWSIFETKIRSCFGNQNTQINIPMIKKYVENYLDENVLIHNPEIDIIYSHFKKRYTNDTNKVEALFNFVTINQIFKDLHAKDDPTEKEKIIYMGIIIYRFRNNIFHGNKEYFNWNKYREEISYCNYIMYIILK